MPSVLLGEFNGNSPAKPYLSKNGWGRMWASYSRPHWEYEGEPWGFDNGAYSCWRAGKEFDDHRFLIRMKTAAELAPYDPCVAVLPDVVGDGLATLAMAEKWLASGDLVKWPWFLAVQDGVCHERVRRMLPHVAGLFLGGSLEFKSTARFWCKLAHTHSKLFHFGRCSRESWWHESIDMGADSIDTTRPLRDLVGPNPWKFKRFEQVMTGRCQQTQLF